MAREVRARAACKRGGVRRAAVLRARCARARSPLPTAQPWPTRWLQVQRAEAGHTCWAAWRVFTTPQRARVATSRKLALALCVCARRSAVIGALGARPMRSRETARCSSPFRRHTFMSTHTSLLPAPPPPRARVCVCACVRLCMPLITCARRVSHAPGAKSGGDTKTPRAATLQLRLVLCDMRSERGPCHMFVH